MMTKSMLGLVCSAAGADRQRLPAAQSKGSCFIEVLIGLILKEKKDARIESEPQGQA
jgi:hypothetical protein